MVTNNYRIVSATGIAALLVITVGVAASTGADAGPWRLGARNHAHHTTKLVSDAGLDNATVKIKNKGDGSALALVTGSNVPPLTVTSGAKVSSLNADRLDGLDSSDLMRNDLPIDADTLDGKDSSAFAEVPKAPLTVTVVTTQPTPVSDTSLTAMDHVIASYDPSGMYSPFNGIGINLRAPRTGTYVVSATVQWASNGQGWRNVTVWNSGNVIAKITGPPSGPAQPTVQTVSGIVHLPFGENASVLVSQSSGGGDLEASLLAFQMTYVGT